MVNYKNGKIYKIEAMNGEDGDIYVGSTTKEYLSQRMDTHRSNYKHWVKSNKSSELTTSFKLFDKYGIDNCVIVLLELVNANSKDELLQRESFYIKNLSCMNKCIPIVSHEDVKDRKKQYHKNNADYFNELSVKYYNEKREEILKRKQEYYKMNKEKILDKNKQCGKFTCVCGSVYRKCDKSQHEKTNKHLKYLDSINGRSTVTTETIL